MLLGLSGKHFLIVERKLMRLVYLTDSFFARYGGCRELMEKSARPYACLEVKIDDHVFAIPFRHHIKHKYAFFTVGEAGLDYSKAVIIEREEYISPFPARIDTKELNAIKGKEKLITNGMQKYYRLYLKAVRYPDNPHYENIRKCSSLQYFLD